MPRRPNPISRVDAAAKKGCDKSAITRACRGPLAASVLPGGDLDSGHPDFIRWQPQAAKRRVSSAATTAAPTDVQIDGELARLTSRFSCARDLSAHLKNRKVLAEAMRIESRNARDDGRIISRAGVESYVLGFVQRLRANLFHNVPTTMYPRVASMVSSGISREEIIKYMRDTLDDEFRLTARSIANALRNGSCKAGDNPPPTKDEKEPQNA